MPDIYLVYKNKPDEEVHLQASQTLSGLYVTLVLGLWSGNG